MGERYKEIRATFALAVPIIVGQASQMLMGITDSVMIGRLGAVPLAAAAFVGAVFAVVLVTTLGLLQPVAVFVAREHGAGRDEDCGAWLTNGLVLALVAGIGLAGLLLGAAAWRDRFGQPEEVVAVMGPYFVLIAVSLVPAMLFQVERQFAEAMGRAWMPMVWLMAGVGLNVFLNWVLIYGNLGAPAWGLTGAGAATLISRTASLAMLHLWLGRAAVFRPAWTGAWRSGVVTWRRLRELATLGVPMGATLFFEAGAFSAAAVMAGWLGTVELAAHQIAIACSAFTFMVPLGVSLAVTIRVGKAVGEGRQAAVRSITFGAMWATLAIMVAITLGYAFGGSLLAGWFVDDAAVIAIAAKVFVIVAVFQLVDGMQVVFAGGLRGLADVRVPTAMAFAAYWLVALPLGYGVGVRGGGGLPGIWVGLAAGLAVASVLLGRRLWKMTGPG